MCWVMPPASPAATSVSRMASSSEVLPWSTWPMIVTTGARGSSSSSVSSNSTSASASSAAWTISISFSNSSARIWIVSSASVWVTIAISPRPISFLMRSGTGTPRYSRDVLDRRAGVDLDDVGLQRWRRPAPAAPRRCRAGGGRRAAAGAAGPCPGPPPDRRPGRRPGRPARAVRPASRSPRGARRRPRRGCARPGARSASGAASALRALAVAVGLRGGRRVVLGARGGLLLGSLAGARRASCWARWRSSSRWRADSEAGRSKPMPVCCGARGVVSGLPLVSWRGALPVRARSASVSSTADAAALTFSP